MHSNPHTNPHDVTGSTRECLLVDYALVKNWGSIVLKIDTFMPVLSQENISGELREVLNIILGLALEKGGGGGFPLFSENPPSNEMLKVIQVFQKCLPDVTNSSNFPKI